MDEEVNGTAPATLIEETRRAPATPEGWQPGASVEHRYAHARETIPQSYNAQARTVEAIFATGYRVRRWFGWEELAIRDDTVDLARVTAGQVRLLDHHNAYSSGSVLGVVLDARVERNQLIGTIRFADSEAGRAAERAAAAGELTGVSVGYRINKLVLSEMGEGDDEDVYRAESWELLEVSLVSVPADPHAGVRSVSPPARNTAGRAGSSDMEQTMENETIDTPATQPETVENAARNEAPVTAASRESPDTRAVVADAVASALRSERDRVNEIRMVGRRAGIDATAIDAAIGSNVSVESFRQQAFDHLAAEAERTRNSSVSGSVTPHIAFGGQDADETRRSAMAEAIEVRLAHASGAREMQFSDASRQYAQMGLAEVAAECIGYRGNLRTPQQVTAVFERAFHTTSDFPAIFMDAMNRRLLSRYRTAAPTYRSFCARYTVADFRPMNIIRAGDFPALRELNEAGEVKFGSFSESKEQIVVKPYAVGLSITRQMIVNDQLGAIDQVLGATGERVADWENGIAFAKLAEGSGAGPVLLTDNKRVFHNDHGNLTSSGTAISVTSVGVGRALMMKQTTLDGIKANFMPSILLTGPDKMTEAEQLLTTLTPATQANAVPDSMRRLSPVGDSNIDGNAWYLFADPSVAPCFVYGYLDGFEGPRLTAEEQFSVQGMRVKLEHDFGVSGIDFRGGYRNAGA